jgi:7,8-dihydropterin-6-yl-methyl-4-(beta-D-ribofuranosyl)aminobenzene 5'-phosphate synthase
MGRCIVPDRIEIGSVGQVSITVLVDNKADLIVESSERVKYFTDEPLLAEHGFSALIQLDGGEKKILWDAGVSRVALMENLRRMKLEVGSIDAIALSHGHNDHYAAMTDLLMEIGPLPPAKEWDAPADGNRVERWIATSRIPLVAHPAAFRERWWQKDDGKLVGPALPAPAQAWQALGAEIILSEGPHQLAPGCWTTGFVPRTSFENTGRGKKRLYRQGSRLLPDDLEDDQAILIHVAGKGLVVLSACAHSGIVNTIAHARQISGVKDVYAVIGGFHLASASDEDLARTVEGMRELRPRLVVPCHCSGLKAACRFARDMPGQFVEGVVGATYLL